MVQDYLFVMTKKQLQFGILFFTIFIDMLGFGIVMPLLPRYVEVLGATSLQMGLLMGVFSLAQLVMLPFWGNLSDRIGRRPVLLISVLGTVIGHLIMGWTCSIAVMMLARLIDGAAGGNISVVQASLADITSTQERAAMVGVVGAAYGCGFILGPALGGWAGYHYGFAIPMFMTAGLAAMNVVLVFFLLPETLKKKNSRKQNASLRELYKNIEKKSYISALLTFFFFVLGFTMITTLLALFFYHRYAMSEQQTGYIYTMFGTIAIVLEGGCFGFLSKRFGERLLGIFGAMALMTGCFFISLTESITSAIGLSVLMALGDSLLSAALPTIVSRTTHEEWQGAAFGFYQSVGCLARCFGPLLAGLLLQVNCLGRRTTCYGQTAFWAASGFLFIALLCACIMPRRSALRSNNN